MEVARLSMDVISVKPKGIYVNIEFSLEELEKLRDGISLSEIKFDGKNMAEYQAKETIGNFFTLIDKVVEDLKRGT
jgi:hypothetical protein